MSKNTISKANKKSRSDYADKKCVECGRTRSRKKKRYFLFAVLIAVAGYFLKTGYEKTFKKTVIMNLMNELLSSKTITSMNLSESVKAKLLYFAEIAAFSPDSIVDPLPGIKAQAMGLVGKHTITIIPGIGNSSLELWKTKKEHVSFFRKRIWGSHSTFTFMFHNRTEWLESMKLNTETGLDPLGRKVRASSGLESSDFSIPGLWFWWKIVENLSYIGYDIADVHFAAFDWRLGIEEMEIRDKYFTKLKTDIELQYWIKNKKTVVLAHSLGSVIFHYFMQWVSEKDKNWVDKHIHAAAYICPPLLGAPKVIGYLLAGDVKGTMDLGTVQYSILELLFGREQRMQLFKTWGSPLYLLPKGGDVFWKRKNMKDLDLVVIQGDNSEAEKKKNQTDKPKFVCFLEILDRIKNTLPTHNRKIHEKLINPKKTEDFWSNPLASPLPNAPNMTIYSLYGVNKETESGYYFMSSQGSYLIDKSKTSKTEGIHNGIVLTDGDGTVPVISMGYMGVSGWKTRKLNPYKVKTVVKEYVHKPSTSLLEIRGGPYTAEHINILGNFSLISDILKIASGEKLNNKIVSNLLEYVEEIDKNKEKKDLEEKQKKFRE